MSCKLLFVFGTRPEAIKMAPVVKAFQRAEQFDVKVCVTAQHREMLDQVLQLFGITPDEDLDLMRPNQDLYDLSARILLGMRDVLKAHQPDYVFVHGDTTTSSMVALASFYQQVPVVHVEAGLRTYARYAPFPEEMNRQLTSKLANIHFAPTNVAAQHLLQEGIFPESVHVVGNSVIDALLYVKDEVLAGNALEINGYYITDRKFILVTGHRRENFGDGFLQICHALKHLANDFPDVDIVYPVHLNPNVQKPVNEILSGIQNIYLLSPQDYLPFVYLMTRCYLIVTDSGGVQEEAPSLGKPVLVMRETTERPEAVSAGTVRLVGANTETIVEGVSALLQDEALYEQMSRAHNPYGDGKASERMVMVLSEQVLCKK